MSTRRVKRHQIVDRRRRRLDRQCVWPHPWRRGDLPTRHCPRCGATTLTTTATKRWDRWLARVRGTAEIGHAG